MKGPKLSVLTTCYNRQAYISECIESILNSSFQDLELVIVDDHSTDASWDIIQSYAAKDSRILAHRNQENLGDYPNRNKAASLASGTYLKYVDADDVIGHFFLDILVHSMDLFPQAGIGLSGGRTWPYPIFLEPHQAITQFYHGEHTAFNRSPLMSILRKSTFDDIGGFSGRQHSGDFELWHMMAANSGLLLLPSLAWVRIHPDQESQANRTDPRVNFRYLWLSLELLTTYHKDDQIALDYQLVQSKKKHIARTILYGFRRHGYKGAVAMKNETKWSWKTVFKEAFQ